MIKVKYKCFGSEREVMLMCSEQHARETINNIIKIDYLDVNYPQEEKEDYYEKLQETLVINDKGKYIGEYKKKAREVLRVTDPHRLGKDWQSTNKMYMEVYGIDLRLGGV